MKKLMISAVLGTFLLAPVVRAAESHVVSTDLTRADHFGNLFPANAAELLAGKLVNAGNKICEGSRLKLKALERVSLALNAGLASSIIPARDANEEAKLLLTLPIGKATAVAVCE